MHHRSLERDVPALHALIATGALAVSLYTRLALAPVHPALRATALATGLAAPDAASLALAADVPGLRLAAITSGQLSLAQLAVLQLHDPDPQVVTAATLALSRRTPV